MTLWDVDVICLRGYTSDSRKILANFSTWELYFGSLCVTVCTVKRFCCCCLGQLSLEEEG